MPLLPLFAMRLSLFRSPLFREGVVRSYHPFHLSLTPFFALLLFAVLRLSMFLFAVLRLSMLLFAVLRLSVLLFAVLRLPLLLFAVLRLPMLLFAVLRLPVFLFALLRGFLTFRHLLLSLLSKFLSLLR
jgi:hypothetical protein